MTSDAKYNTYDKGKQAKIIADLMDLFKSNNRGYGVGEFSGAKFNEDKQKWTPGHVRWAWGATSEKEWHDHLSGVKLLGQGVLCDDNRVWYACLDIDSYELDYAEEMNKIKRSGLPLVTFISKSAGLRIIVFFCEAIEADVVVPRMRRVASQLGYAGCEIFPKQTKLIVEKDDCPSWIYMPFGGTHDMFAEQGCINEHGNLMDMDDAIEFALRSRISQSQFMEMFAAEDHAKANGKANGKKHPKGAWVEEETEELTIATMFHDGPPCLWYLSREGVRDYRNNFLLHLSVFLKKKYPENWAKPFEWVNFHVLKPSGDVEKMQSIIKGKDYEYTCHQEPMASRCFAHACRRMPYGVGKDGNGVDFYDMGMTVIERIPNLFILSFDGIRMVCEAEDLLTLHRFRVKCLSHGVALPPNMKKDEWDNLIRQNLENAVRVPPTHIMRTNAAEIEFLTQWLSIHVPTYMRVGSKDNEDTVRVKEEEKRIYFKDYKLMRHCRMLNFNESAMRGFIDGNCQYHDRKTYREWFRSTYSISFDMLDEEDIEKWMASGKEK